MNGDAVARSGDARDVRDKAGPANRHTLARRIAYAVVALPVGYLCGFYAGLPLFTRLGPSFPEEAPSMEGYGLFTMAVAAGVALGLTAALVALTLPWMRLRKRRGRAVRIVVSAAFILFAALAFAGQGHAFVYDAAFVVWLVVTMTFTVVRYGVLDQARRSSPSRVAVQSGG